jgi:GntR family transcriptional regulator
MHAQVPKYATIKALLEVRWERSMLPGDRLPSEAELCADFDVSRATVQQALRIFERDGVIRRDQGRGTFYVGPVGRRTEQEPARLLETLIQEPEASGARVLNHQIARPPARVAQLLGLPRDEPVVMIERLCFLEGVPLVFSESFLPAPLGTKLLSDPKQLARMSLAAVLSDGHGVSIMAVRQSITARLSDPRYAPALGIDIGVPVLEGERIYLDAADCPVFCTISTYRSDRHAFVMHVKDWR